MSDPLLAFRGVGKRFGGVTALDDVCLEIRRGEVHAIVGENGAGKSTLMKILSGALTEYAGQIELEGRLVRFQNTREAERAGVRIIYQELNLVDDLSVAANLFLGHELQSSFGLLNERRMRAETARQFSELGSSISPDRPVRNLRVGDQQLVEIAKALLFEAKILIMDEPTSALSEGEVERLFDTVEALRSRGVTILYISHKMQEVFRLADHITVLRDGRSVWTAPTDQTDPEEVARQMVGREIASLELNSQRAVGEEVLRVEKLSLSPGEIQARGRLRDVSFSLHQGEILGVAGLLGAGRTELLECLFGAAKTPPTGRVILDGRVIELRHPSEAAAAGLALVTEDRKRYGLFDQMSVASNISLVRLAELARAGVVNRAAEQSAVRQSVGELGIRTSSADAPMPSLSGGNQQKCILARWLLTEPKVLLLDEPTRGIDVGAKADLYVLMHELCRTGLAILMTSSELPELLTVCDRILVLSEGRKTAEFDRAEATEEKILHAAVTQEASGLR